MVALSKRVLEKPLTKTRAAEAVNLSRSRLYEVVDRFILEPSRRRGDPLPKKVTLRDVWSLLIARHVKGQGESLETAMNAADLLNQFTSDEIISVFSEGRSYLFIIDGRVCPALFSLEAIRSGECEQLRKDLRAESPDFAERWIDTKPLLDQLLLMLEEDLADTNSPVWN